MWLIERLFHQGHNALLYGSELSTLLLVRRHNTQLNLLRWIKLLRRKSQCDQVRVVGNQPEMGCGAKISGLSTGDHETPCNAVGVYERMGRCTHFFSHCIGGE